MFSQEQIKEIQYKLGLLGKKDTSFPLLDSITGDEVFVVVKNAINMRVPIISLANAIHQLNKDLVIKEDISLLEILKNNGSGNKYLSDDGTYKTISGGGTVSGIYSLNIENFNFSHFEGLFEAYTNKVPIVVVTTADSIIATHVTAGNNYVQLVVPMALNPYNEDYEVQSILLTAYNSAENSPSGDPIIMTSLRLQLTNKGDGTKFLSDDGTYKEVSSGGITEVPVATSTQLGGIQLGYTQTDKKYPIQLEENKAYVEVPWENTTYTFTPTNPTLSWGSTSVIGKVGDLEFKVTMPANPFPYFLDYVQSDRNYPVLHDNNKLYVNVPWTDTTYDDSALVSRITTLENKEDKDTTYDPATQTTDGLMSAEDKVKLDGLTGAYIQIVTSEEYETMSLEGTLDENTIYHIKG